MSNTTKKTGPLTPTEKSYIAENMYTVSVEDMCTKLKRTKKVVTNYKDKIVAPKEFILSNEVVKKLLEEKNNLQYQLDQIKKSSAGPEHVTTEAADAPIKLKNRESRFLVKNFNK